VREASAGFALPREFVVQPPRRGPSGAGHRRAGGPAHRARCRAGRPRGCASARGLDLEHEVVGEGAEQAEQRIALEAKRRHHVRTSDITLARRVRWSSSTAGAANDGPASLVALRSLITDAGLAQDSPRKAISTSPRGFSAAARNWCLSSPAPAGGSANLSQSSRSAPHRRA